MIVLLLTAIEHEHWCLQIRPKAKIVVMDARGSNRAIRLARTLLANGISQAFIVQVLGLASSTPRINCICAFSSCQAKCAHHPLPVLYFSCLGLLCYPESLLTVAFLIHTSKAYLLPCILRGVERASPWFLKLSEREGNALQGGYRGWVNAGLPTKNSPEYAASPVDIISERLSVATTAATGSL